MVFKLPEDEVVFPDPELADPDGLLAIGGDLSRERLLMAYGHGIFPWFSEGDPICWFSPPERCVIYPAHLKVSKSMKKVIRDGKLKVRMNSCFDEVIRHCAHVKRNEQDGTWITTAMQLAYIDLHQAGHAHSIEVFLEDQLVGGLYGIKVNQVFCGESMFSLVSNASKMALIWLVQHGGYCMIDCQIANDHLISLGAEMISRTSYLQELQEY